ncbi:penicillin-binding protein activator [Escherichia coli]
MYDTSSQPLSQILSQVQQDGASIVVGPLLKNNVEELLKSNTPLNVLALNQPENIEIASIFVTSRFHRKYEGRDAARHIRDQGKRALLVLIPRSSLGDRVAISLRSSGRNWAAAPFCNKNLVPPANYARVLTAVLVSL